MSSGGGGGRGGYYRSRSGNNNSSDNNDNMDKKKVWERGLTLPPVQTNQKKNTASASSWGQKHRTKEQQHDVLVKLNNKPQTKKLEPDKPLSLPPKTNVWGVIPKEQKDVDVKPVVVSSTAKIIKKEEVEKTNKNNTSLTARPVTTQQTTTTTTANYNSNNNKAWGQIQQVPVIKMESILSSEKNKKTEEEIITTRQQKPSSITDNNHNNSKSTPAKKVIKSSIAPWANLTNTNTKTRLNVEEQAATTSNDITTSKEKNNQTTTIENTVTDTNTNKSTTTTTSLRSSSTSSIAPWANLAVKNQSLNNSNDDNNATTFGPIVEKTNNNTPTATTEGNNNSNKKKRKTPKSGSTLSIGDLIPNSILKKATSTTTTKSAATKETKRDNIFEQIDNNKHPFKLDANSPVFHPGGGVGVSSSSLSSAVISTKKDDSNTDKNHTNKKDEEFPALMKSSNNMNTTMAKSSNNNQVKKTTMATIKNVTNSDTKVKKEELTPQKPKKKKKKNNVSQQQELKIPFLQQQKQKDVVVKMDEHHSSAGFFATALSSKNNNKNTTSIGNNDNNKMDDLMMRMLQQQQDGPKKGKQRLKPRKKKFTTLKKKVLEERLRKWKELHPDNEEEEKKENDSINKTAYYTTVCLYGFCEQDEIDDDDEYEEIIENLNDMANKIGNTKRIFIPRTLPNDHELWPVFVEFDDNAAFINDEHNIHAKGDSDKMDIEKSNKNNAIAKSAVECWNGLVLAGQELKCYPLITEESSTSFKDEAAWQDWCITKEQTLLSEEDQMMTDATTATTIKPISIILTNALTEDDLEDEECMEESMNDVQNIANKFGTVEDIIAETNEDDPPTVKITYMTDTIKAKEILDEWNKVVIGGVQINALMMDDRQNKTIKNAVRLQNVLTEDDLEDDDCLQESLNDIKELAQQYGDVINISVDNDNEKDSNSNSVIVQFSNNDEAKNCVKSFNGLVIGGMIVLATIVGDEKSGTGNNNNDNTDEKANDKNKEPEILYSCGKIIPERFAKCKRVPKIPNQEIPVRQYATLYKDENTKPLLTEMLSELMRLQKRISIEENKNAKARRRLVMGLREVARGIRSHKVKMVVMANNLDEYGIIDNKVQEIIDLASNNDVPIFYEFTKRTLGRAVGKTLKLAVIGIQNADGAHQQFKKLIKIASTSSTSK